MARIALPDPDEIEGPHADAVQASKQRWGFVGNIERALALWPELASAEQDLTAAVLEGGEVPPRLKEAIGVVTSQVNACDYCATHHTFQMERTGWSEAEQEAINALRFDELDDDRDRAALAFAETAASDPNRVTDADVETLHGAGFDEREVLEIVTVVALFAFYNTFTTALGIELDPEVEAYRRDG